MCWKEYYRVRETSGSTKSINAVGFIKHTVPAGYSMLANPLNGYDNRLSVLLQNAGFGDLVLQWDPVASTFRSTQYFGSWTDPHIALEPGKSLLMNVGASFPVIFIGEVVDSSVQEKIPSGSDMMGSHQPFSGQVDTVLKFPVQVGDSISRVNLGGSYTTYTYTSGGWSPSAPSIGLCEGFWSSKSVPTIWDQSYALW